MPPRLYLASLFEMIQNHLWGIRWHRALGREVTFLITEHREQFLLVFWKWLMEKTNLRPVKLWAFLSPPLLWIMVQRTLYVWKASGTIAGQILSYSNPTILVWPTFQTHVVPHLPFSSHLALSSSSMSWQWLSNPLAKSSPSLGRICHTHCTRVMLLRYLMKRCKMGLDL